VLKGKIAYMAPEQLQRREVTRSADVYALGVVLWEMLAGQRLFQADSELDLMTDVLSGATEPPSRHRPDVPDALDAVVMSALASDPAERCASAQEMADVLQRVLPPAFPAEVGRWVADVAGEVLAGRDASLADIENNTAVVAVAEPNDALDQTKVDLEMPSQPSSVSVETPIPEAGTRHLSPRAMGVVAASVLVLIVGAFAVTWSATGVRGTVAATGSAATVPAAVVAAPATATASVTEASPSALPVTSATQPSPVRPSSRPPTNRRSAPPVTRHADAPPALPSKRACDPPYVIDSAGDRQYKTECL
jgi:serine/threonine-protein kinase